jgi:hypothetical protein
LNLRGDIPYVFVPHAHGIDEILGLERAILFHSPSARNKPVMELFRIKTMRGR